MPAGSRACRQQVAGGRVEAGGGDDELPVEAAHDRQTMLAILGLVSASPPPAASARYLKPSRRPYLLLQVAVPDRGYW